MPGPRGQGHVLFNAVLHSRRPVRPVWCEARLRRRQVTMACPPPLHRNTMRMTRPLVRIVEIAYAACIRMEGIVELPQMVCMPAVLNISRMIVD